MQCTAACQCPGRPALDARLEALQKEVRELKLKLFWKEHNTSELKPAMRHANQDATAKGPDCACLACAVSGRMDEEKEAKGFDCAFKPYFEALLAECGLGVGYAGHGSAVCEHEAEDTGNLVYDNDTHLVHVGRDDWVMFTYGAKLWQATAHDDPELQKLARLFELLWPAEENDA